MGLPASEPAIIEQAKAAFLTDPSYLVSVIAAGHRARASGFPKSPKSVEPEKFPECVEPAWEGYEPPDTADWKRVLKKISVAPGGCWVWSGGLGGPQNNRQPYAYLAGKSAPVRRWAYAEMHRSKPGRTQQVKAAGDCHLLCVNPEHLRCTSGSQASREYPSKIAH